MSRILLICCIAIATAMTSTAQESITLQDIWQDYTFYAKSVPGFNFMADGQHYTRLEKGKIEQYDLTTGEKVATILDGAALAGKNGFGGKFDSYTFSGDEQLIVLKANTEKIYRRSSIADFYLYDRDSKVIAPVFDEGKISYATLSPDNQYIAFVHDNNLYYRTISSGETVQVTTDGEKNKIINGSTDWVYEEEFSIVKAFEWSPDSKHIGFIRFDETEVAEFTMMRYNDDLYPQYETWKYPKVGTKNADVTAHIYSLKGKSINKVDVGDEEDIYLPRITWADDDRFIVTKLNRHQNLLELYQSDTKGKSSVLYKETNKYYIDITDDLTFLADGSFITTSEKEGYNQIYHHDKSGELKRKLTTGNYEVTSFYGISEEKGRIYYQSTEQGAYVRHVYSMALDGTDQQLHTPKPGTNSAQWSSTYDYFVNRNSTINTPPVYTVWTDTKRAIRSIEDNAGVVALQQSYNVTPVEYFKFTSASNIRLEGYMIKPPNFDATKQYPVFMYQYSGPGSQSIGDSWKGNNYWWFQMLAQQGYIVACVDGRGTGGKGEEWKKMTYLQLGKYEVIDQIDAATYLAGLDYVDGSRIGIYGWSYGGHMSSLAILKGNDVFKAAIAVAPVTSWKWYDTIYTERYMRTVAENEGGYADNSPVYFADKLKGAYLLVHGLADDNVHWQHTAEMSKALIAANKQFDTYLYPNRNHGIYGDNARIHLFTKMTNFIKEKI
jgi:dipeptidyl-peptidase-4